MSAFAERALIGGLPPNPRYEGRLPGKQASSSGGLRQDRLLLLAPGTQAPTGSEFWKILRCTNTAWCGKAVAAGLSSAAPQGGIPRGKAKLCTKFFAALSFQESARPPDGTQGPIGRVFKSGGPPGRGGPAVGPWARPGACGSPAAPREDGRPPSPPVILCSGFLSGPASI